MLLSPEMILLTREGALPSGGADPSLLDEDLSARVPSPSEDSRLFRLNRLMTVAVSSLRISRTSSENPGPLHCRLLFSQRPQTGRTPSHLTRRARLFRSISRTRHQKGVTMCHKNYLPSSCLQRVENLSQCNKLLRSMLRWNSKPFYVFYCRSFRPRWCIVVSEL
jgi:hypothetical protein